MAETSDNTTRQITIGVIIALLGFTVGTIGTAALQPNPYLEDRKFIQETIRDLKSEIKSLKYSIEQLQEAIRRNSKLYDNRTDH